MMVLHPPFSAASGRGLIEGLLTVALYGSESPRFPRHRAAASLKEPSLNDELVLARRFPRHRAAASLKASGPPFFARSPAAFSAASGRGLIEGGGHTLAAGGAGTFFRGIGPRPH